MHKVHNIILILIRLGTQRVVRVVLLCLGLILFAGLWWLYFENIATGVKGWWGRRYIPEIRRFMAAEDWANAARSLNDANRWAPQDSHVLRTAVDFVDKTGSEPRTMIRFLSQLDEKGELLQMVKNASRI